MHLGLFSIAAGRFFAGFLRFSERSDVDNSKFAYYNTTILRERAILMRSFHSVAYFYFYFIGDFR